MINVEIKKDKLGRIIGYKIEGHSNYADYGEDIVCAAISVLAQTSLSALVEVCGLRKDLITYSINEDDGYLDVELGREIQDKIFEKTQIVLKTLELGIKSIIDSYPRFVTLKYRRCER